MSYQLDQSRGTLKLLLESGNEDYGTLSNPSFAILETVNAPYNSIGLMGVEKVIWKQPNLFPTQYMTCNLTIANATGTVSRSVAVDFANVQVKSSNSDVYAQKMTWDFDADTTLSGANVSLMLQGVLNAFTNAAGVALTQAIIAGIVPAGETINFGFSCPCWGTTNWMMAFNNGLGDDDVTLAQHWVDMGYPPLTLLCGRQNTTGSFNMTISETNVGEGFLSRILNIPSGTFTRNFVVGALVPTGTSPTVNLKPHFDGVCYMKLYCNYASGYRQSDPVVPGLQRGNLMSLIPGIGGPGNWETYINNHPTERLTVSDLSMDAITLKFVDESGREMTAIKNYVVVISIDYMEKDLGVPAPTLAYGHSNMTTNTL